ncbi:hypothetical protein [Curtobacterium sp. MCSS17_016]|uniref:hypothetical protein n=1 Tax=Curtobacterium sp. MCSS17_016 TaxID=2175644 RepID=UPI000DA81E60|nr:hypothetical protein [Curtobacterium sp. MCSS17_016]WIE81210.1 hypothetical protein DEJ19_018425 [Curtobacterium sp. MCSS17_016]
MTRSLFPKSFFAPRHTARRAAFRASARTAAAWRRAAEAGDYYLIEKPPLVRNSGQWTFHADYHRFRNRAGEHLARRNDFAVIEQAHRRAWQQRETPGLLDTSVLDALTLRVSNLERLAGLA